MSDKREKVILVYCSKQEKKIIAVNAKQMSISVSSYLRHLGLRVEMDDREHNKSTKTDRENSSKLRVANGVCEAD